MRPRMLTTLANARFRKFSPIDRERPIFELVCEDVVLFDVARNDDGIVEVAIHEAAANKLFALEDLLAVLDAGRQCVDDDENAPAPD